MIPKFEADGNLPPGIHNATWAEFIIRFGTNDHRKRLLTGLKAALAALELAGCKKVYIDGSFVTEKEIPNDYDGCWDTYNVDPRLLDPVLLVFDAGRASQKAKYLGELFPNGIEGITGKVFSDFFQIDKRTGNLKGIIAIDLGGSLL